MTNILDVFWEKDLVGQLWLGEGRQLNFQYESSWLNNPRKLPISLRLPLQKEVSDPEASTIFFSNLLPEAEIRKALSQKFAISEGNNFRLLVEVGGECAGALSLVPKGTSPEEEGDYLPLSSEELSEMIDQLPQRPFIVAKEGVRLSLAGAQNKLPLYMKNNLFYLPRGFKSSSHILKPPIFRYEGSVENEAYCMQLAQKINLSVPAASIYDLGKYKVYLVERYDRYINSTGDQRRIHQEDFCQALGYYAEQKYENEGGPGYKECFSLIDKYSHLPLANKIDLVRLTAFNFIIGNSDAHGKNLSLLFNHGQIQLAPFYDLMSTCIYSGLNEKMAMKIGGKYERGEVAERHWLRHAEKIEVPFKIVKKFTYDVANQTNKMAPIFAHEFISKWQTQSTIEKIVAFIDRQSRSLMRQLDTK